MQKILLTSIYAYFPKIILFALVVFLISGCQGDGGGDNATNVDTASGASGVAGIELSGGGADGPLAGGVIKFSGADNNICGDVVKTDDSGKYTAKIPVDCIFPIRLSLTDGYDLVSEQYNHNEMMSLILDSDTGQVNVTPLTTIIYYAALSRTKETGLSSLSASDLDFLIRTAMRYFNFGIFNASQTTNSAYNPFTSKINTDNACIFVKANEGLIETIRRTAISQYGIPDTVPLNSSINHVLQALGDDISDGVLDGRNINGATSLGGSRMAALWNINAANVSMELMQNQFSITMDDGSIVEPAANRLVNAAEQVAKTTFVNADIENVEVSLDFINQAIAASSVADNLFGGGSVYGTYENLLTDMKFEIEHGSPGTKVLTAAKVRQILSTNLLNSSGITEMATAVNSMGETDSSSTSYDNALTESSAIMSESSPVSPASRQMHIAWSYPESEANINGFNIYIAVNGGTPQVCSVLNAAARSADCNVEAVPGDSVSVSMTAITSANLESDHSESYSNAVPVAEFTADRFSGKCPMAINFDASATGNPVQGASRSYDWYFDGDGTSSSGAIPVHEFNYSSNALLKVTDTTDGVFQTSSRATLAIDCL